MIIDHPDLNPPEPTTRLFRFCSFEKFRDMINSSCLYFRHITLYKGDDPDEGTHTDADVPIIGHVQGSLFHKEQRDPFDDLYYVNCWTEETPDNKRFWQDYTSGGDGVCIATYANRIRCALYSDKQHSVYMSHVRYIDRSSQPTFSAPQFVVNMIEKCFAKGRDRFSWEKEVRLMHILKDIREESTPGGSHLPVDLGILIDGVYISPYSEDAQIRHIKNLLAQHSLSTIPVKKVSRV